MQKRDQSGATSAVVSILLGVLLIAVSAFAVWAFRSRQDYKDNTDQKINAAVSAAKETQAAQLKKEFAEQSKSPNKTYQGPSAYGSVTFKYPKTWSAYVDETNSSEPINGYFYPDKVPGTQSPTAFALRIELISSPYAQVMQQFDAQIKQGTVKAAAYVPPKIKHTPNIQPGTKLNGVINRNQAGDQQGSMVVIQVRDKTLEISTQSPNFLADFNNTILATLSFIP